MAGSFLKKQIELVGFTPGQTLKISKDAVWPSIVLTTNQEATLGHTWKWEIKWRNFQKSGTVTTTGNSWDATSVFTDFGGDASVSVYVPGSQKFFTFKIRGENPSADDIRAYLKSIPDVSGFDKLIYHETKFLHFETNGEPKRSFDNGYGLCQLTNPIPTYQEIWNWQKNIDAGVKLYQQKQRAALGYLSQASRAYTDSQLQHETLARWNGGNYHIWSATAKAWIRNPNILCDSQTGNIGWDMTNEDNKGKTEAELHKRDARPQGGYEKRKDGDKWIYSGVCYADAILD